MSAKVITSTFKTTRETAKVTTRDDVISIKNVQDGTEIQVVGYVKQEIVNENTGEIFNSVLILASDNKVYATRGKTFMRRLDEIIDIISDEPESDEPFIIRISHGTSRSGNKFATCSLA